MSKGAFHLSNGLFFSERVLTTTHFIEHKMAWEKQCPTITLNDNSQIKINKYN